MLVEFITDGLNKMSQDEADEDIRRIKGSCWPSDASIKYTNSGGVDVVEGSCLRELYYKYTEKPTNVNSSKLKLLQAMGKSAEEVVLTALTRGHDASIVSHNEKTTFQPSGYPFIISLEFDLIVNILFKKNIGLEIKTGGGYMFTKDVIKGSIRDHIPAKPRTSHLLQVAIYLDKERQEPKYDIKEWSLLYIERGSCDEMKEYVVTLDDKLNIYVDGEETGYDLHSVYDRYYQLTNALVTEQIPNRDFQIIYDDETVEKLFKYDMISKTKYTDWTKGRPVGDWQCQYCSFKDKCWDIQDGIPNILDPEDE